MYNYIHMRTHHANVFALKERCARRVARHVRSTPRDQWGTRVAFVELTNISPLTFFVFKKKTNGKKKESLKEPYRGKLGVAPLEPWTSLQFQRSWWYWCSCHILHASARSTAPRLRPTTHPAGANALPKPKNHHLERSKPCRAGWWRKATMCINRWCREKPKKTPPELTALLRTNQAGIDTFCGHYDS